MTLGSDFGGSHGVEGTEGSVLLSPMNLDLVPTSVWQIMASAQLLAKVQGL